MSQLVAGLDGETEVFQAPDCARALEIARTHSDIDLVLLDLNLPGLRGIPALERFRQDHPATPVVIVSMFRDRETVNEALRRGAMGFVPKSSSRETIVNALRLVLSGAVYVPPEAVLGENGREEPPPLVHARSASELGLTARQGQVLALLMKGRSNKQISRDLKLAERTVKAHMSAVMNALKVTSRTQAVITANRLGLDADTLISVPDTEQA
jgi:DNA-binding NarL/FixJ family response regulator